MVPGSWFYHARQVYHELIDLAQRDNGLGASGEHERPAQQLAGVAVVVLCLGVTPSAFVHAEVVAAARFPLTSISSAAVQRSAERIPFPPLPRSPSRRPPH